MVVAVVVVVVTVARIGLLLLITSNSISCGSSSSGSTGYIFTRRVNYSSSNNLGISISSSGRKSIRSIIVIKL